MQPGHSPPQCTTPVEAHAPPPLVMVATQGVRTTSSYHSTTTLQVPSRLCKIGWCTQKHHKRGCLTVKDRNATCESDYLVNSMVHRRTLHKCQHKHLHTKALLLELPKRSHGGEPMTQRNMLSQTAGGTHAPRQNQTCCSAGYILPGANLTWKAT
jgi:hypothetical protein